jgi:hypothetical protein
MLVFGDLINLAKPENLMRFREICLQGSFDLPDILFTYDADSLASNPALKRVDALGRFQLDQVVKCAKGPCDDLAKVIEFTSQRAPRIVAYFVTVTFPTLPQHVPIS